MTEGMRKFATRYQFSLNDPDLRRMYEYELSAIRDQQSRERNAVMNERTDVIHSMLRNSVPVDMLYKCINAPRSEVDTIIAKIRTEN